MNMGMMGALGGQGNGTGLGGALMNVGYVMLQAQQADADVQRKKDFQAWLMQAQDDYKVKDDSRAWQNEQDRAPTKAQIAANTKTTEDQAALDFKTKNIGTIAADTQTLTNAGKTPEDRAEAAGKARYWNAYADDVTANGKSKGRDGLDKSGTRLEPDDEMEYKSLDARVKALQGVIDKAQAEPGGWDPEKNPGQKQLQTSLAAAQLRQQAILAPYRDTGGAGDPLGIRKGKSAGAAPGMMGAPDGKTADGKPYVMKSPRSAEPAPNVDGQGNFSDPNDPALISAINDIKDPQERANARLALTNQKSPTLPPGGKPAAAPAAAPGAPATSTGADPLAAFKDDPAMDTKLQAEDAEMGDGKRMQYSPDVKTYADKVRALKLAMQAKRRAEYGQANQKNALGF